MQSLGHVLDIKTCQLFNCQEILIWYRVWSDTWKEQGAFSNLTYNQEHIVNFIVNYSQMPNIVTSQHGASTAGAINWQNTGYGLSLTNIKVYGWVPFGYYVCGF